MQIEIIPLSEINPYDQNPRDNAASVDIVSKSISEFGWQQPIVIDDQNIILAGHTRHLAALKLGLEEVPVHKAMGLSEAQKRAFRIVDNKSSEIADWNKELLKAEFSALQEFDFDLTMTGFDLEEISKLIGDDMLRFEDDLEDIEDMDIDTLHAAEQSHVKMFLLYLNTETEPEFRKMCVKIQEKYGIDNVTDAVFKAVENECSEI